MFNIIAVIVTNNRLELLKEAIAAVMNQTYGVKEIIVVNNDSNDGTTEWLAKQTGLNVINQENTGGSGGFYSGIAAAINHSPDWVWVMDDDTICRENTLQILAGKISQVKEPIGFIGSKCVWKDGSPHLMNLPAITPSFNRKVPFNKYDDKNLLLTETSSFVSLLINARAIKDVGLPYKEFFIWGDDQEYTRRITKSGYLGLYCMQSVVLHKTGINYFPDFYHDTPSNLWKHNYGFRNEFFMVKKNRGFVFFMFWLITKVVYTSLRIIMIRKDHRFKFIAILLNSAWRSIFFSPKIAAV